MAVTASDTTDDPAGPFAGFYVGSISGGAAIKVRTMRGQDVVLAGVVAGTVYTIAIKRVWTTGTTASLIFGMQAVSDVR